MSEASERDAVEREALRLADRYAREVVDAFGLCPWSASVRDAGRLHREVIQITAADAAGHEQCHERIEELARDGDADVALLIFPLLAVDRAEFRRFVAGLERAHADANDVTTVAMAAFHPDAELDLASPARLVPFLRRTPDPTIQVVRRDALTRARKSADEGSSYVSGLHALAALEAAARKARASVSDGIARTNHRTVTRVGPETIEAVLADIRRDRDRAYAGLVPPRPVPAREGRPPAAARRRPRR